MEALCAFGPRFGGVLSGRWIPIATVRQMVRKGCANGAPYRHRSNGAFEKIDRIIFAKYSREHLALCRVLRYTLEGKQQTTDGERSMNAWVPFEEYTWGQLAAETFINALRMSALIFILAVAAVAMYHYAEGKMDLPLPELALVAILAVIGAMVIQCIDLAITLVRMRIYRPRELKQPIAGLDDPAPIQLSDRTWPFGESD